MWMTTDDPFASNLGMDENWNELDYLWVFFAPFPFLLYFETLVFKPKFSVLSDTDHIYILTIADSDHWKWSSASDIA
jgi:hypothetical protein